MTETSYRCPSCGFDNEIFFEADGAEILELWTDEDTDALRCRGCLVPLDRDEVYVQVSIDHAGDMTDAATDYEPADR